MNSLKNNKTSGWARVAMAAMLAMSSAQAAVQGPDAQGYTGSDSVVYSFIDISGGGGGTSVLAGIDDGAAALTLPFNFNFYGTNYNILCASTNGAVYFTTDASTCNSFNNGGLSDFQNTDLSSSTTPGDMPAIFPLWSDLSFADAGSGSVFYATIGAVGNRRFVIQWNNVFPAASAGTVTFQLVLAEGTNSATIQYKNVDLGLGDPNSLGANATVGIREAAGQTINKFVQWSYNSGVLANTSALIFQTSAAPSAPTLTSPANGAVSVLAPVTLTWNQAAAAINYDVYFGTANPPPLLNADQAGTSKSVTTAIGTTYFWQIKAKNVAGTTASAIQSFSTPAPPPPAGGGGGGGGGGGAGSALTAAPDTLSLTAANGTPAKQTVTITYQSYTQGAPVFSSNVSTNQGLGWLSVSPATGTMKEISFQGFLYTYQATVDVIVNPAGIASGSVYAGTASFGAAGGIAQVGVTMNVVAQATQFTLAPQSLTFSYRKGGTPSAAQNIALTSKPTGAPFATAVSTTSGGNWLAVSPTTGTTPGSASVSVNSGIVANLAPGTYTGKVTISGDGATSVDAPVTLTVARADAPVITQGGIVPVYSSSNAIQSGSWISIYGTNLAATTEVWKGDFPTALGGVTVTINGKPGYLWFVSPGQINLQAPDDTASGTVTVVITNGTGTFSSTVTLAAASPSFSLLDSTHVAALAINADGSYDIVGPVGTFAYPTRPVKPGDNLVLFGVGFGPTNPPIQAGKPVSAAAATANPVTVTIGGVQANVVFSGIVGAGLYQLNVTVPPGVPSGEQPVRATVTGLQTGSGPVVTIQ